MGPHDGDDDGLSRRTPTPETVAMRNLRSFSRDGGSRRWYTSWWVPIIGAAVVMLLLLMVAA